MPREKKMLYLLYSCVSECAFKRAHASMKTIGLDVQNINEKCLIAAVYFGAIMTKIFCVY